MKQTYVHVPTGDKVNFHVFPNTKKYRVFNHIGYFDKELKKDGQPNRIFIGTYLGVHKDSRYQGYGLPFVGKYSLLDERREAKAQIYRDEVKRLQELVKEAQVKLFNLYAEEK